MDVLIASVEVQEWQEDPTAKLWFSQISDYIKSAKHEGVLGGSV